MQIILESKLVVWVNYPTTIVHKYFSFYIAMWYILQLFREEYVFWILFSRYFQFYGEAFFLISKRKNMTFSHLETTKLIPKLFVKI